MEAVLVSDFQSVDTDGEGSEDSKEDLEEASGMEALDMGVEATAKSILSMEKEALDTDTDTDIVLITIIITITNLIILELDSNFSLENN
jgi:hypothetical protein